MTPLPTSAHPAHFLTGVLLDLFSKIPDSHQLLSPDPHRQAKQLKARAQRKAALISATLSLPPGPWGIATILPDLIAIWKLQEQLVADIAGCYGKQAAVNRRMLIYCLFRHGSALAVRDLVVRVGERFIVQRASFNLVEQILQKIGLRLTKKLIGKGLSRWLPLVGTAAMAGYAFYDTGKVAETAIETFCGEIVVEPEPDEKKS